MDHPQKRGPGRPRTIERAPTPEQATKFDAEVARLTAAECEHPVVVRAGARDSVALLETLLVDAARESAELGWLRRRGQARGQDIQRLATRRIRALVNVADLVLTLERARNGEPSAANVARVVELFLEAIEREARSVLPPEDCARFLSELGARVGAMDVLEIIDGAAG